MIYAVIIGFLGEHFFSRGLDMYTYRLENVPHYVPPGHALVYVAVLYFSKDLLLHHPFLEEKTQKIHRN